MLCYPVIVYKITIFQPIFDLEGFYSQPRLADAWESKQHRWVTCGNGTPSALDWKYLPEFLFDIWNNLLLSEEPILQFGTNQSGTTTKFEHQECGHTQQTLRGNRETTRKKKHAVCYGMHPKNIVGFPNWLTRNRDILDKSWWI